jgi:hypothetical protein
MASTIPFILKIQADPTLHIRSATGPMKLSQHRAALDGEHHLKAGRPMLGAHAGLGQTILGS